MGREVKFTDGYQIETKDGFKNFDGVSKMKKKREMYRVTLEDGEYIDVTSNHSFVINRREVQLKNLIIGEWLETESGSKKIKRIEKRKEPEFVFDVLEVDTIDHAYYANGINNHNCKFLGSSDTLVDGDVLERLSEKFKEVVKTKWGGVFKIFEEPIKPEVLQKNEDDTFYILGIDTAKGGGADYSVVQVIKVVDEFCIEQVAIYRHNGVDTHQFAQVCIGISKYYNEAQMMIENNGVGGETATTIWYEYENENIINLDKKGLGVNANRKTKLEGNLHLKRYLENGWLALNDNETVTELSKYIEVTPDVYKAETRTTNDDCVTSLLWGMYFLLTEFFDGKDMSVKKLEDEYNLVDEDEAPLLFIT
tara:strand:- start:8715 stop:9809 length:1095 start_codon:yes stop_codon:yes gene_type:complete